VLSLSFLIMAVPVLRPLAAQPTPAGPETRVDTLTGVQYPNCPKIGVASDRSFEIAWDYAGTLPSNVEVRHYDASGAPTDPSERTLDTLGFYPVTRAVTPVSNGFRVLMEVIDDLGGPSKFFRHRIAPDGVPASGGPRLIGTRTTQWVSVGPGDTLFAGTFNATAHRYSVQKIDSTGKPSGPTYVLNTRPINGPNIAHIAPLSDGGWVAVFAGYTLASTGSPSRQVLRARRFNAAGKPTGPDFDVNSIPAGLAGEFPFLDVYDVEVAGGPGGRFAVLWVLSDATGDPVRFRSFDAANVPAAPDRTVAVEELLTGPRSIAFDNAGRALLLWSTTLNNDPLFPAALHARLVRPNGSPLGPVFSPQTGASGDFDEPFCGSVAWAGDSWLITWAAQKGDSAPSAVFLRRFH
jgi:hypothetical protein